MTTSRANTVAVSGTAGPAQRRILLIAAEPAIDSLITAALSTAGCAVECGGTGADGRQQAGERDYDLVILDLAALDELAERVRVQLSGGAHRHGEVIRTGGLSLDLWRLQADSGHGPVPLTRLEFMLLRELMEHPGESVPKDRLLASIWGYDFDPHSNVVDVCVRRLRTKLGFELIKTVRGEGYQLTAHPGIQ